MVKKKIGVDIERKDEGFFAKRLANKFYSKEEKVFLNNMDNDLYHYNALKFWVFKRISYKMAKRNYFKRLIALGVKK